MDWLAWGIVPDKKRTFKLGVFFALRSGQQLIVHMDSHSV